MQKAFKKAGHDIGTDLKKTNFEVAKFVRGEARGRARGLGGVAAKAAPSLRASRTGGYVQIQLGSARHPYALGAEFGAKKYKQFKPWTGPMTDAYDCGYFLGPSVKDNKKDIIVRWEKGVTEALNRAIGA